MPAANKASPAIIVAGIIAIAGSILCALGIVLMILASFAIPQTARTAQLPPHFQTLVTGEFLIGLAITILGIFCGVGLLRLKNWARVATLICSGFTAGICVLLVLAIDLIPFPSPTEGPQLSMGMIRMLISVVYAIPLGIAVWWLILFNRKKIVAQFTTAPSATPLEGGDHEGIISAAPVAVKPSVPIPILALAILFIISSLSFVFLSAMPLPVLFFGHPFYNGIARTVLFVLSCGIYAAAGIGLMRARQWAYSLGLGVQSFWLFSGIVSILTPGFQTTMQGMISNVVSGYGENGLSYTFAQLHIFVEIGLVVSLVTIGILLFYRRAFLEAAAARS